MSETKQENTQLNKNGKRESSSNLLQSITRRRIIAYTSMVFLFLWISFFGTASLRQNNIKSSLTYTRNYLHSQANALSAMTTPNKIEKGQIDSALPYIINTSQELASTEAPSLPHRVSMILARPLDKQWHDETSQLTTVSDIEQTKKSLLGHHAGVLQSLQSVISYNPQADLHFNNLPEKEIDARIAAAQKGIAKTKAKITDTEPYSTKDNLGEVADILESLQKSLDNFDQNRDKKAWYEAVATAQSKIIGNRQSFWEAESQTLLTRYAELRQNYSLVINQL